jgi:tetratricopeptide (TPR) repeat protein
MRKAGSTITVFAAGALAGILGVAGWAEEASPPDSGQRNTVQSSSSALSGELQPTLRLWVKKKGKNIVPSSSSGFVVNNNDKLDINLAAYVDGHFYLAAKNSDGGAPQSSPAKTSTAGAVELDSGAGGNAPVEGFVGIVVEEMRVRGGAKMYSAPSAGARVLSKFAAATSLDAAGYVDRPDGRYWTSKWSLDEYWAKNRAPSWIRDADLLIRPKRLASAAAPELAGPSTLGKTKPALAPRPTDPNALPDRLTAEQLTSGGWEAFTKGEYDKAVAWLTKATQVNPNYALGHYNLARVFSFVRDNVLGGVCDLGAYRPTILDHLEKAIAADPSLSRRLRQDKELHAIQDTVRFQRLIGVGSDSQQGISTLLTNVTWYGEQGSGVYSCAVFKTIHFSTNGRVVILSAKFYDDHPEWGGAIIEIKGRYRVADGTILIDLDSRRYGSQAFSGTISPDGVLSIPNLGFFTDDTDECSA